MLLRPLIARLRASGGEITLVAPGASGSLLATRRPPEVERLLPWDDVAVAALFGDAELPPFARDCDVCIAISRSPELAASLERAAIRHTLVDPTPVGSHASDWYAAAGPRVGLTATARPGRLEPTERERVSAQPLLDQLPPRFVAIHPGAGSRSKTWPFERFARVAAEWGSACLWLEGPAEKELAPPPDPPSVVADDLPLGVVLALLHRATAYLGNDSGVSHLAAAAGTPSVVLFGPTDPAVWRPAGDQIRVLRGATGEIAATSVEEVLEALRSIS